MPHSENMVRFAVNLPPAVHAELSEFAAKVGASRGYIVRTATAAYIRMAVHEQPTCADGTSCLCLGRWGKTGPAQKVPTAVVHAADQEEKNPC